MAGEGHRPFGAHRHTLDSRVLSLTDGIRHDHRVRSVGFLHVASSHVRATRLLVAEHAPWIVDVHIVDGSLLDDLVEDAEGRLVRLAARIGELVGRDVDAVVCTCPELLGDAARAARGLGVPAIGVEDVASLAGAAGRAQSHSA